MVSLSQPSRLILFSQRYHILTAGTVFESWRKVCRKTMIYSQWTKWHCKAEIPDLPFLMMFSFIHCPHAKAEAEVQKPSVFHMLLPLLPLMWLNNCYCLFICFSQLLDRFKIKLDFLKSLLLSSPFGLNFTNSKTEANRKSFKTKLKNNQPTKVSSFYWYNPTSK